MLFQPSSKWDTPFSTRKELPYNGWICFLPKTDFHPLSFGCFAADGGCHKNRSFVRCSAGLSRYDGNGSQHSWRCGKRERFGFRLTAARTPRAAWRICFNLLLQSFVASSVHQWNASKAKDGDVGMGWKSAFMLFMLQLAFLSLYEHEYSVGSNSCSCKTKLGLIWHNFTAFYCSQVWLQHPIGRMRNNEIGSGYSIIVGGNILLLNYFF